MMIAFMIVNNYISRKIAIVKFHTYNLNRDISGFCLSFVFFCVFIQSNRYLNTCFVSGAGLAIVVNKTCKVCFHGAYSLTAEAIKNLYK